MRERGATGAGQRLRWPLILVMTVLATAGCSGTSPYAEMALAMAEPPDAVYFVIDTSASMGAVDQRQDALVGGTKIDSVERALSVMTDQIGGVSSVGLLSYPGRAFEECGVGPPLLTVGDHDDATIRRAIGELEIGGNTPTAEALAAAAAEIQQRGTETTLVLMSDGLSTCDLPCPVAQTLDGVTPWSVIVIGFDLGGSDADELRCIADVTDGRYISIADGAELEALFSDPNQLFSVTG